MLRTIVYFTFLHLTLSHATADEGISNLTDLMPMALSGHPYVVNSLDICPPDSEVIDGICKCNLLLCDVPSCDQFSYIVRNGTDNPGNCCPLYTCDNCTEEMILTGNCTCGKDAFLNSKGDCECIDPHRSIIDGNCVCDPQKCELPRLCDNRSVAVKEKSGCCFKIICKPCPEDSYAENFGSEEIEDKCVCYPCPETQCNETHVPLILRRGTSFPHQCCDLYQCIPKDTPKEECIVNDLAYSDGQWWMTEEKQNCTCNNGVSLCDEPVTPNTFKHCLHNDTAYPHLASWTDDACTNCTCSDGVAKCIAHLCNVSESRVTKYEECLHDNRSYQHLDSWTKDCMNCTCYNGFAKCEMHMCNISANIDVKKYNCPSLDNCKRFCKNGFKINRRGCEICKCRILESVVEKYPHLEIYMKDHNISENDTIELLNEKNFRKYEQTKNITSSVDVHGQTKDSILLPSLFCIIAFFAGVAFCYMVTKCLKKRCACHYSTVSKPMDNNNLPTQGDIHPYISEKSPLKT